MAKIRSKKQFQLYAEQVGADRTWFGASWFDKHLGEVEVIGLDLETTMMPMLIRSMRGGPILHVTTGRVRTGINS